MKKSAILGPRGGRYTLTASGQKNYLTAEEEFATDMEADTGAAEELQRARHALSQRVGREHRHVPLFGQEDYPHSLSEHPQLRHDLRVPPSVARAQVGGKTALMGGVHSDGLGESAPLDVRQWAAYRKASVLGHVAAYAKNMGVWKRDVVAYKAEHPGPDPNDVVDEDETDYLVDAYHARERDYLRAVDQIGFSRGRDRTAALKEAARRAEVWAADVLTRNPVAVAFALSERAHETQDSDDHLAAMQAHLQAADNVEDFALPRPAQETSEQARTRMLANKEHSRAATEEHWAIARDHAGLSGHTFHWEDEGASTRPSSRRAKHIERGRQLLAEYDEALAAAMKWHARIG